MVSWSLETLLLALYVIAILCAAYVSIKSTLYQPKWGAYLVATFAAFFALRVFLYPLIAGVIVIALQAIYVRRSYPWKTVGRIWMYTILCWGGSTYLVARREGWIPEPWREQIAYARAGAPVVRPVGREGLLPVDGGLLWYHQIDNASGVPVILVHGGPGIGSFSLKPLEALADERPVVRYDQLGAGHSERTTDTTAFAIPSFVARLDSLRTALGYDRVHLVGHAWGSIIALEYYRSHPERVASLTLASPLLSSKAWSRNADKLLTTLSDSVRFTIAAREGTMDYDAPDYADAVREFAYRYVSLRPNDTEQDSTLKSMNGEARQYLWGPSAFRITGALRSYDATRALKRIKVPTLYTVGEFDVAGPTLVARFAKLTPASRLATIPDAASEAMWDNPEEMLRVVREFLRSVDSANRPQTDNAVAAGP